MEKREDFDAVKFRDSLLAYQDVDQIVKDKPDQVADDAQRAENEGFVANERVKALDSTPKAAVDSANEGKPS